MSARTSSSYGHAIYPLTDLTLPEWVKGPSEYRHARYCSQGLRCPNKALVDYTVGERTYTSELGGKPTHFACYMYVTGRAGRVTRRDLWLCETCAAKWTAKHVPAGAQ